MELSEINKRLEELKKAMKIAMEETKPKSKYAEVLPHFTGLISYYQEMANEITEKETSKGGLTINDLNKKYRNKYLYFNGDEAGSQFIYVDKIHIKDDEFVVDGTLLDADAQNYTIKVESVKNYAFHDFYYFDDYYAPFETCEELDKMLESNPLDTDLPSHVASKKYLIECVNADLGFFLGEEAGDDEISDMFNNIQSPGDDEDAEPSEDLDDDDFTVSETHHLTSKR